jgi:heparanase 1
LVGCSAPDPHIAISVERGKALGTVSERFLSLAVDSAQLVGGDWWDAQATVGGMQPVPPFDFTRAQLRLLAGALAPAYLRLGGTDADRIYYDLGDVPVAQAPAPYRWVLSRQQWNAAAEFAQSLDFQLLFTLNAGPGPRDSSGAWQPDQARALLQYSAALPSPVAVWELGNEINGYPVTLDIKVAPEQYARDIALARTLVAGSSGAKLAAPASAYWPILGEPISFLPAFMAQGGGSIDVVTWHYYPQQSRRCPAAIRRAKPDVLLDPDDLDEIQRWIDEVTAQAAAHAPSAEVWLGETGNAQCGGEPGVSDAFVSSLWWLDELGIAARRGMQVVVRQSLTGANYGLLDEPTLTPRPDYWASLLWRRSMGVRVLDAHAPAPATLRVYAHCARAGGGGVTLLAINLDSVPVRIGVDGVGGRMQLWVVTAAAPTASTAQLNGTPLALVDNRLPTVAPLDRAAGSFTVPATAYAFAVYPEAAAVACR